MWVGAISLNVFEDILYHSDVFMRAKDILYYCHVVMEAHVGVHIYRLAC